MYLHTTQRKQKFICILHENKAKINLYTTQIKQTFICKQ